MAVVQELVAEGLILFLVLVEEEKHIVGDSTLQQSDEMCDHPVIQHLLFEPLLEGALMIPVLLAEVIEGVSSVHDHQLGLRESIKLKQTRLIHL